MDYTKLIIVVTVILLIVVTIILLRTQVFNTDVTIVMIYFNLENRSKHSSSEFYSWMSNVLPYVETPIVIYTQPELVQQIQALRGSLPMTLVLYENVWELLAEIPYSGGNLKSKYESQRELDPERHIHRSAELYAIWNCKALILDKTVRANPYKSNYFLYVDIGSFRRSDEIYRKWPDVSMIHKVIRKDTDFVMGEISAIWPAKFKESDGPVQNNTIQGTFFLGTKTSSIWFAKEFYRLHNLYLDQGMFIGKDQDVYTALAALDAQRQHNIRLLQSYKGCGEKWVYFQPYFASYSERPSRCKQLANVI